MADQEHDSDLTAEEEEEKRRRRIFFWIFLGAVIVIAGLVLGFCGGADDEQAVAPGTTETGEATTSTTEAPATTAEADMTTAAPPTVDGVWSFTVDVTVTSGACLGEENEEPPTDPVTIRQDGNTLTVVGLGFPKETQVWEGRIEGNTVTFWGLREEDEGTTDARFTLEVDFEAMTMSGREDWTWEDPQGFTCPDNESVVTVTWIGP